MNVDELTDRITDGIVNWSKSFTLPGFGGVVLYDVVDLIYQEMLRDNITTRANSVAFSLFIAIFPFLIFLFTLLPYLPITLDYLSVMRDYTEKVLPANAADYLMNIVADLVAIERGGLRSLSILLSVFFASNGVLTLMYGFDKSNHEAFRYRSYFKMRWVAFWLTLILTLLFLTAFVLLVLGNFLLNYVQDFFVLSDGIKNWLFLVKWIVSILLLYTSISTIYRYGPSYKNVLPFFNSGGLIATIMLVIISIGFSYFVNNFGRYNEIYGSIGALLALLLWLQFNAFAILIGFELNASIIVNKYNADNDS